MRQLATGLAFLSPWLFGFLSLTLIPVVMSAYFSLTDYSLLQRPAFVGLDNYRELMTAPRTGMSGHGDPHFWTVVRNTCYYAAVALPAGILLSLGLALLLNLKVARAGHLPDDHFSSLTGSGSRVGVHLALDVQLQAGPGERRADSPLAAHWLAAEVGPGLAHRSATGQCPR